MKGQTRLGLPSAYFPAAAIVAIVLCFGLFGHPGQWPDNIDNWTYWELSQNLLTDFYRVWTLRSFAAEPSHSTTYPPLYPFLILFTDMLSHWGPASGQLVNFASIGVFAWLGAGVGRAVTGSSAAGLLAAAATLCFLPFSTEILGARTQPVALALTAAITMAVVGGPITTARAFSIGLLAGLAALTRADAIAAGAMLGLLVFAWSRHVGAAAAYGSGAVLGASPWALHSLLRYHTIYANESRWSAGARQPGLWSSDWVVPPGPAPITGVADLYAKLHATIDVPIELASDLMRHTAPLFTVLGAAAAIAVLLPRRHPALEPATSNPGAFKRLTTLLLVWPPLVLGIWMADYASVRYLSGPVWHVVTILVLAGSARLGSAARAALPLAALGLTLLGGALAWRHGSTMRFEPPGRVIARVQSMEACLRAAGAAPDQRVLFARNEVHGAQFGALAHWYSSVPPHNASVLSAEEWDAFLRRFQIRFAVEPAVRPTLPPLLEAEPLPGCPEPVHRVLP